VDDFLLLLEYVFLPFPCHTVDHFRFVLILNYEENNRHRRGQRRAGRTDACLWSIDSDVRCIIYSIVFIIARHFCTCKNLKKSYRHVKFYIYFKKRIILFLNRFYFFIITISLTQMSVVEFKAEWFNVVFNDKRYILELYDTYEGVTDLLDGQRACLALYTDDILPDDREFYFGLVEMNEQTIKTKPKHGVFDEFNLNQFELTMKSDGQVCVRWTFKDGGYTEFLLKEREMPEDFHKKIARSKKIPCKGDTFKHFKRNNLYQVVDFCTDSDTLEPVIIYRALYEKKKKWSRKLSEFISTVELEDKTIVPRFQLVDDKS
jgi:hypothetical protein